MAGAHGTLGCFSFYPTKNLGALGDAGAIVTGDRDLAAKLRALRTYGWGAKYHCAMEGGMNSRMDELQAAVLRAKLPHLDGWNRRRREIAARYAATIRHPAITLPAAGRRTRRERVASLRGPREGSRIAARASRRGRRRDRRPLSGAGSPAAGRRRRAARRALPSPERACAEVLSLPCYPELTAAEIDAVAAACNRWQPDGPYSLVIPVYRNEESIPDLLTALAGIDRALGGGLEVVFVVDGSPDRSLARLVELLPRAGFTAKILEMSRNFGAFAAIRAGLTEASGPYFAVMAADLQEPPELAVEFFRRLEQDTCDVVCGVRTARDDPWRSRLASNLFWAVYRRLVQPEMPPGGVDVFGCNARRAGTRSSR